MLGGPLGHEVPEPGIGHHPPSQEHLADAPVEGGGDGLLHLNLDQRFLERRGHVLRRDGPAGGPLALHVPDHGGLQPREREVVGARPCQRPREPDRARVPSLGQGVEGRTAREPQAQEPGDLVEGLSRRVVERLPQ